MGDLDELEREFRRWIEPLFLLWWQRFDEAGRAMLKRSVGEGTGVENLSDAERRGARSLVDAGFVIEQDGQFRLWGRAWQDFVHDAA